MVSNASNVKGERYSFSADIKKLMGLIVNAFYSNKDVFLREVISNASDAIDKIRFKSLTDPKILGDETDLKIEIVGNTDDNTLTIRDNGIGMSKEDLIKNLGSIATSGTKSFMDAIKAGADIQMIGQFGVGFYSVFLVSDKVQVRSKHNDDIQHVWESTAGGEFDIFEDSKNDYQLPRGTEIILHLKEDLSEYTEERRLKEIIKKHSEFVGPKIYLWTREEVDKEVTDDEAEEDQETKTDGPKIEEIDTEKSDENKKIDEKDEKNKSEEVKDNDESNEDKKIDLKKEKKTKKIKEVVQEFKVVNQSTPIWKMKPDTIEEKDYFSFYKTISNDWEDPLAYKHFHVEGELEFTGVLFIPKRAPFDLFNKDKKSNNIKLYVRRVFINEDAKDLCPEYLSFVKGVIDSEEMPLNISRETLQQNNIMKIIRKNVVKKTIELIEEISEDKEKFDSFYKNFAKNLKFGVHEDAANRRRLADLLKFPTTKSDSPKFLRDYLEGMPKHQKDIYYITGESLQAVKRLPFLERLAAKNLEVLLMIDPIDEYFVQQMSEYDGRKLISVTKEGIELPESDEEKKNFEALKKEFEPFCKRVKEILGNRVEKVEVSNAMNESPCLISTGRYGWSSRMEQIMKNQALRDTSFTSHMTAKKILAVNPKHPIIKEMNRRFIDNTNDPVCKNLVFLVHNTAMLTSGGLTLDSPAEFADSIYKLARLGLNLEDDADEEMPPLEDVANKEEIDDNKMEDVD